MDAFIKKINSYTRTDIRYIARNSGPLMLRQVVTSGVSLLVSIAFARYLSKETFGTYQYIIAISGLLAVFSLTGLSRSIIKSVSHGHDGVLDQALRTHLLWSIPSVLIGGGIGGYYLWQGNLELGFGVLIVALLAPLTVGAKLYIPFLNGKEMHVHNAIFDTIGVTLPSLALLAAILLTDQVPLLVLTLFGMQLVFNFALYAKARTYRTNEITDESLTKHSFHLSAQTSFGRLIGQIDSLLLFQLSGPVSLANLFFSLALPRQVKLLFTPIRSILLPRASSRSLASLRANMPRRVAIMYVAMIPITIGYIVIAPYVFNIFFPQYHDAVLYSQVYSLVLLLLPIRLLKEVFVGHNMQKALYQITILSGVIKLTSAVVLIPLFNIWGVLASMMLTAAITDLVTAYMFMKLKPENLTTPNQGV